MDSELLKLTANKLKLDEGFSSIIYYCTEDKKTIGYGRNLDDNPLTYDELKYLDYLYKDINFLEINRAQALYLLEKEIIEMNDKLSTALDFYDNQSNNVKYVLLNVAFNCGKTGLLKFVKTLKYIKDSEYKKASVEILDSEAARKLKSRYNRLSEILSNE